MAGGNDPGAERRDVRLRRRMLTETEQLAAAHAVADRIATAAWLRPGVRVGAYAAFDGEIDLAPTIGRLWELGAEVYVPVTSGTSMRFVRIEPSTSWRVGRFGIREPEIDPDGSEGVEPGALDVVLVPAVMVDASGNRMGMGGGFYDRAFAEAPRPVLVATVHDLQVVDRIEAEPHDVPVDAIVTPTRWIDVVRPD